MTTLERLTREGYRVEERWRTAEVLGFVRREIGRPAWPLRGAFASLATIVAWAFFRGTREVLDGVDWWGEMALPFALGAVLIVALVVPHELTHGLAFRLLGAPRVVYGADWRQLVFHASAPGFALGPRRMTFVALAPFALITPPLVYVAAAGTAWWAWLCTGALLMHTQGCLGDFAMVNYFARGRAREGEVLTLDEEGGKSFVIVWRPRDR